MGVISRQVFKNNLLSYLALAVGILAQLYVFNEDVALKGHADTLLKSAMLLLPFMMLGMNTVMVRFLPYIDADFEEANAQLFTRGLVVTTLALLLLGLGNYFFADQLVALLEDHGFSFEKLRKNSWTIYGLLAAMMYSSLLTTFLVNHKRIAIPVLFNNLFVKIGTPVIFLFAVFGYYDRAGFNNALVLVYILAAVGLLLYVVLGLKGGRLKWGKLKLKQKTIRDLYGMATFSILGSLGSILAIHIDTLSVNAFLGDTNTGIYSFGAFAVSIILIPYKAVNSIASPIVSKAWKENNMVYLEFLYKESAKVLFATGAFVYVGLVVCLPDLYMITENMQAYRFGYAATVILGAGIIFDQLTSINNTLFSFTDYYRWAVFFVLLLGLGNVYLNYLFIGKWGYGIEGAAYATMLTLVLYNISKGGFLYFKMGIHPLSKSLLYTCLVGIVAGGAGWYLPNIGVGLLNLVGKGLVITIIFAAYFRFTGGVPPIRNAMQGGLSKLFK